MTPLEVAQGMANFLKERLAEYEERGGKEFHVYAGFLPRARRVEELEKLCPAIVIRPEVTTDEAKQSTVSLVLCMQQYTIRILKKAVNPYSICLNSLGPIS